MNPTPTNRFFGAQVDMAAAIARHVFVISPNQSGSTFLIRALGLCNQAWELPREGQHAFGFVGPDTLKRDVSLTWAASAEDIAFVSDAASYDWSQTRKAWYFQASAASLDAKIFVTKSPPFLLIADQLVANFKQTSLIYMVRNPYAVVEGIARRTCDRTKRLDILDRAARHVLGCFEHQRKNLKLNHRASIFLTYEDMCANPLEVQKKIVGIIPEFDDLRLDRKIKVKGIYDERLRDMNADQIGRLGSEDLKTVNSVFRPRKAILDYFGYDLIL